MSEPRRKLSILVPPLPWEDDRSELSGADEKQAARENLQTGKAGNPNLKAWKEATQQATINALGQTR
jgi:hypothetical protein